MSHVTAPPRPPAAWPALALLLSINLFNYIDRYVLSAVLPYLKLDPAMFSPTDPYLNTKLGSLTTAFLLTYMFLSPVFGYFGDRVSRWAIIGGAVILWSLASGASGLAVGFGVLLLTRCLVGVGEAAYGPVAPAVLSDMYPEQRRGFIMAVFYMAIPVGSALGFVLGGQIAGWEVDGKPLGWRAPFFVVAVPGLLLGVVCFFMRDTTRRRPEPGTDGPSYKEVLRMLLRIPSYRWNCLAQTAATFAIGGIAVWMPTYIFEREARFVVTPAAIEKLAEAPADPTVPAIPRQVLDKLDPLARENGQMTGKELAQRLEASLTVTEAVLYNERIYAAVQTEDSPSAGDISTLFGAIVVLSGLGATLGGGILADRLRGRFPGSYFLVSGGGALVGLPFFVAVMFVPFPLAWGCIFLAVFCLFMNTGPANTILANVVPARTRATAFAINILVIHLFGDAISPVIIGGIADFSSLGTAFLVVGVFIAVSGVLWILGAPHLRRDTDTAEQRLSKSD